MTASNTARAHVSFDFEFFRDASLGRCKKTIDEAVWVHQVGTEEYEYTLLDTRCSLGYGKPGAIGYVVELVVRLAVGPGGQLVVKGVAWEANSKTPRNPATYTDTIDAGEEESFIGQGVDIYYQTNLLMIASALVVYNEKLRPEHIRF
jgi:hypothetical protein